jgi:hypothetical protein
MPGSRRKSPDPVRARGSCPLRARRPQDRDRSWGSANAITCWSCVGSRSSCSLLASRTRMHRTVATGWVFSTNRTDRSTTRITNRGLHVVIGQSRYGPSCTASRSFTRAPKRRASHRSTRFSSTTNHGPSTAYQKTRFDWQPPSLRARTGSNWHCRSGLTRKGLLTDSCGCFCGTEPASFVGTLVD